MQKPFSISYYSDDQDGPLISRSEFTSIAEAVAHAQKQRIGLSRLTVTQWETNGPVDYLGVADIIGSVNLDTAHEMKLTDLTDL